MENRTIGLQEPMRETPKERVLYDLPKQSKIVILAPPSEESKLVLITQDLTSSEETILL